MRMYCGLVINETSAEIEQCVTSDYPVSKEMMPLESRVTVLIKTIPPTPETVYRYYFCEFECESFARSREVMDSFEMENKTINGDVKIKLHSRYKNLKEIKQSC